MQSSDVGYAGLAASLDPKTPLARHGAAVTADHRLVALPRSTRDTG
jgi:hypothetical protein